MTITNFDKSNLPLIINDINTNLKKIGNHYGISFVLGKVKFSKDFFKTKLECVINQNDNNGVNITDTNKILFNRYCNLFGLTESDYGITFGFGDKAYKIIGIRPKSRKYNILVKEELTGKEFKFPIAIVKERLQSIIKQEENDRIF